MNTASALDTQGQARSRTQNDQSHIRRSGLGGFNGHNPHVLAVFRSQLSLPLIMRAMFRQADFASLYSLHRIMGRSRRFQDQAPAHYSSAHMHRTEAQGEARAATSSVPWYGTVLIGMWRGT